jgi:hypothetical protein
VPKRRYFKSMLLLYLSVSKWHGSMANIICQDNDYLQLSRCDYPVLVFGERRWLLENIDTAYWGRRQSTFLLLFQLSYL